MESKAHIWSFNSGLRRGICKRCGQSLGLAVYPGLSFRRATPLFSLGHLWLWTEGLSALHCSCCEVQMMWCVKSELYPSTRRSLFLVCRFLPKMLCCYGGLVYVSVSLWSHWTREPRSIHSRILVSGAATREAFEIRSGLAIKADRMKL